jgi:hypothetical protein
MRELLFQCLKVLKGTINQGTLPAKFYGPEWNVDGRKHLIKRIEDELRAQQGKK